MSGWQWDAPKMRHILSTRMDDATKNTLEELVDEVILGLAFDMHREVKLGLFELENSTNGKRSGLVEPPTSKKGPVVTCAECGNRLAASRYVPHLEKCMGGGRKSLRFINRKIANNAANDNSAQASDDDCDRDDDWGSSRKSRSKRKKKNKNSPRGTPKPSRAGNRRKVPQTNGGDMHL